MDDTKYNIPYITNKDIEENIYPEYVLEANIERLCLRLILYNQKVSPDFCYKYFWDPNDKYMKYDCDDYHRDDDDVFQHEVLFFQPHIKLEDLHNCDEYHRRVREYNEKNNIKNEDIKNEDIKINVN